MKICFYGVGGVGGYFGSLIAGRQKNEHLYYFIARGSHKEAIDRNGLTLKMNGGQEIISVNPQVCTDNLKGLPVFDIIIVSVKSYDLPDVATQINQIVDSNTIILPLLNGVDIYDRFREYCKTGIVLPACVYVGTHIESPGVIFQKGGEGKILLGCDPMNPEFKADRLLKLFDDAAIQYSWEDNIQHAIWSKFMFIAGFGLVTAVYQLTLGQIIEDAKFSQLTKNIMNEIYTISKVKQIGLPKNIIAESFQKAHHFPRETKTSFQRDVETFGKRNEGDLFGGTIIRYGKEFGIATPFTNAVYGMLVS